MWSIIALTQGTEEALIWSRPSFSISRGFKVFVLKWIVWIWTLTTCSHLRGRKTTSLHHITASSSLSWYCWANFTCICKLFQKKLKSGNFWWLYYFFAFLITPFHPTFVTSTLWWYFSVKILVCIHLATSL